MTGFYFMEIQEGATIWARQTIESEIFYWKPDKWFKIWFYIVNRVNHKDTKLFQRGTAYIDYDEIAKKTGSTYGMVQSFIRWAKKSEMLSTQKSTRGNIIKIINYAKYQTLDNYKVQAKVQAQSKHNPSTIHAINKNDKNDKNVFAKAKNKPLKEKYMFKVWNEELGDWEDHSRKKPKPNPLREPAEKLLAEYTKGYVASIGDLEEMPRVGKEVYLRQAYGVLKVYRLDELLELLSTYFEEEFYKNTNWSIQTFLSYKVLNTLKSDGK